MFHRPLTLLVFLGVAAACRSAPPTGSQEAGATETRSAELNIGEKKGLEASGNDATIAGLARDALKCSKPSFGFFDLECPAYQAWTKLTTDSVDVTMLNLIEDPDPRARFLGAIGLPQGARRVSFREDPALAKRLVAATAKEADREIAVALAWHVARVDVEKTGQLTAIADIVRERRHHEVATKIVERLLSDNSSRPAFDMTRTWTTDPDAAIRKSAVSAFWMGGGRFDEDRCGVVTASLDDKDAPVAAEAAEILALRKCGDASDAALVKTVSRYVSAGTDETKLAVALSDLCKRREATPAQRAKAAELAKTMSTDPRFKYSSSIAKRAATECTSKK